MRFSLLSYLLGIQSIIVVLSIKNVGKSSSSAIPVIITSAAANIKSKSSNSTNGIFAKMSSNGKYELTYYGLMLSGAVARSISATVVHPLTVIKTMLQKKNGKMPETSWRVLSRGAGSQFMMSIPHGAINFAVTETTKLQLLSLTNTSLIKKIPKNVLNPALDFLSSSISTFVCSVVSTPQMVLTDRIMAGQYPDFLSAIKTIFETHGFLGFYLGWFPALVQKIPSYALTWMFFQQLKTAFSSFMSRAGTAFENLLLGSLAAAAACCVMIPVDTIKTRIVTQGDTKMYHGMIHCLKTILKEEGVGSLYRALPPRLLSVVPMIGIQFAVYELMKRILAHQPPPLKTVVLKKGWQRALESVKTKTNAATTSTSKATATVATKTNAAVSNSSIKDKQKGKN